MEETVELIESEKASRWSRLWAALIDMLIMMAITLPIAYFMGSFEYIQAGKEPPLMSAIVVGVISITSFFAVNGKLLKENGQTVGKRINNIKIVNLDDSLPDFKELIIKRYIPFFGFPYIPFIGGIVNLVNVCWIFGKESRCLHDVIANTKVIKG